jgi:hypothetical protein
MHGSPEKLVPPESASSVAAIIMILRIAGPVACQHMVEFLYYWYPGPDKPILLVVILFDHVADLYTFSDKEFHKGAKMRSNHTWALECLDAHDRFSYRGYYAASPVTGSRNLSPRLPLERQASRCLRSCQTVCCRAVCPAAGLRGAHMPLFPSSIASRSMAQTRQGGQSKRACTVATPKRQAAGPPVQPQAYTVAAHTMKR